MQQIRCDISAYVEPILRSFALVYEKIITLKFYASTKQSTQKYDTENPRISARGAYFKFKRRRGCLLEGDA